MKKKNTDRHRLVWLLAYANAQSAHFQKLKKGIEDGAVSFKSGRKTFLLRWLKPTTGENKQVTYYGGANRATRRALEKMSRKFHGPLPVPAEEKETETK